MTRRTLGIAVATAVLLPLTAAFASGGWWVHTVENLPEYLVAGQPVEMSISLRQHGIALMTGPMEVHMTGPNSAVQLVKATPSAKAGYHTVELLVTEPGEWKMALQSGHMRTELLPLKAIAAGGAPPARLTAAERGRQLYVAKGCLTCHGSQPFAAGPTAVLTSTVRVGAAPELIGRAFPSREYVERVMANPEGRLMPNLNLSRDEINAIATFLHPEA